MEVLAAEKTEYDEEGVKAIIALADGGMRDALSTLDQVLAYSGNHLHEKDVLAIYGLASLEEKIALLQSLNAGDVASVVRKAESFVSAGLDVRRLVSDLIGLLKDLLIYEKTSDATLLEDLDEERAQLLSKTLGPVSCNTMISFLLSAQNDFKNVSDVRSLFELTLLRIASLGESGDGANRPQAKSQEQPKKEVVAKTAADVKTEEPKPKPVEPSKPAEPTKPVESLKAAETKPIETAPKKSEAPKENALAKKSPQIVDETVPPDFLFEEEKPEEKQADQPKTEVDSPLKGSASKKEVTPASPSKETTTINISNILKPAIATDGIQFELPDEEIVKIMVLANKAERTSLAGKWHHFADLKADPRIGALASLLSDGHPFCICQDAIILSYNFTKRKKEANVMANQQPLEDLLKEVITRKVFVYAIDRIDANRLTAAFFNLQQINKLPKKEEVKLNLPLGGNK